MKLPRQTQAVPKETFWSPKPNIVTIRPLEENLAECRAAVRRQDCGIDECAGVCPQRACGLSGGGGADSKQVAVQVSCKLHTTRLSDRNALSASRGTGGPSRCPLCAVTCLRAFPDLSVRQALCSLDGDPMGSPGRSWHVGEQPGDNHFQAPSMHGGRWTS